MTDNINSDKVAKYLAHAIVGLHAGTASAPTRCPECGRYPDDDHVLITVNNRTCVVIGCEGYWTIDPATIGLPRGNWQADEGVETVSSSGPADEDNDDMILAEFDTINYTFHALGRDRDQAETALSSAWDAHAASTGADARYLSDHWDDVTYAHIGVGAVLRDGEWFYGPQST